MVKTSIKTKGRGSSLGEAWMVMVLCGSTFKFNICVCIQGLYIRYRVGNTNTHPSRA